MPRTPETLCWTRQPVFFSSSRKNPWSGPSDPAISFQWVSAERFPEFSPATLRGAETPRFPVSHLPILGHLFTHRPTDCFAIVHAPSPQEHRLKCSFPSFARFPLWMWMCRVVLVPFAVGDGETQCLKMHSGEAQHASSLRSQAVTAPCGFTPRAGRKGLSSSKPRGLTRLIRTVLCCLSRRRGVEIGRFSPYAASRSRTRDKFKGGLPCRYQYIQTFG